MLASFLLTLREGMEAALVIGITLGILHKSSFDRYRSIVWTGAAAGGILSLIIAVTLNLLEKEFEGQGEMLFEGSTLLLAAGLLAWMIIWMQARGSSQFEKVEQQVNTVLQKNKVRALGGLAFLAVLREGVELSVFLLAARVASDAWQTIAGTLLGVAAAFLLGWLFFTSTRILQVKTFFRVTNVLLTLFAAGMVGLAVGEFIEAGWLRVNPTPIWNLTPVLPDTSFLGGILKALFGYNPAPSLTAVLAYVVVALVLFWLVFRPQVLKKPAQVS